MLGRSGALGAVLSCSLVLSASPALADDIRPAGVLERGTPEREGFLVEPGGRWVRVGGRDATAFYALGGQPWRDWIWPAYAPTPALLSSLVRAPRAYETGLAAKAALEADEITARAGLVTLAGGALAVAGGLVYDFLIPNNPRQMHWSFYAGSGAAIALGLGFWGGGTLAAWSDLGAIDRAIAIYNRDILRR